MKKCHASWLNVLPENLRLMLVRYIIMRSRRVRLIAVTSLLNVLLPPVVLTTLLCASAYAGYRVGQDHTDPVPAMAWLPANYQTEQSAPTEDILGRMRAEMIRLRVMFATLAQAAKLEGSEFEMAVEPVSRANGAIESSIDSRFSLLNRNLAHMSESAVKLQRILREQHVILNHTISGRPLAAGSLSSRFGYRIDPITGNRELHRGADFTAATGAQVHALAEGVVSFSAANAGYGLMVELEHGGGYRTRYAHNRSNLVSAGQFVNKGEAIAQLGSTGRSTGPHVHIEVRLDNAPVDPMLFIRKAVQ